MGRGVTAESGVAVIPNPSPQIRSTSRAAAVAMFGFVNLRNDTITTPLEEEPVAVRKQYLAKSGWSVDKHRRRENRRDNAAPSPIYSLQGG